MANRKKKSSSAQMQEFIHSLRGKYRHLPLMQTLKKMKREEKDH
jgi:hypothetical protein